MWLDADGPLMQYRVHKDVTWQFSKPYGLTVTTSFLPTERTASAIFFSGATYFVHFLALGFSSFPLQTHLRKVLTPSSASLVASIIPIAACITYFLFRFAESRGWMKSPRLVLFGVSAGVATLQLLLGWRLHQTTNGSVLLGAVTDIAICMLMLGCVQSSAMTLLNHIGVSTMGDYAYSVRAAGSAGYMVALLLMGSFGSDVQLVADYHLFIGATVSFCHALVAFFAWMLLPSFGEASRSPHESTLVRDRGQAKAHSVSEMKTSVESDASAFNNAVSGSRTKPSAQAGYEKMEWFGLLLLVWMVAICEMSYGLYAHEFLTSTYGSYGYFVFAGAVAIEIGLLVAMPFVPRLKRQLLFVGPLGWLLLFSGCLMATQGFGAFGLMAMALALNCPFQISTNEHAHRMNPSVMGVASMTLAQSIGYTTATVIASVAASISIGPVILWSLAIPLAMLALVLAVRKLARENAAFDVHNFCEPSRVPGSGTVASAEKRPNDFERGFRADDSCTDAEDVHVVVLDALASGVGVMAEASPDSGKLVRRHAHANS
jgi:hypothetical protein